MLNELDLGKKSNTNEKKYEKMPHEDEYETGDILLFSEKTFIPSRMIEYFTESKYSHVGIILKDPTFINESLKGIYILESTGFSNVNDVENNKKKVGVQIRDFRKVYDDYNGAIYWRKLNVNRTIEFYDRLTEAHKVIHNKPYDTKPRDWIATLFDIERKNIQLTDRFFCSAMVSYVYKVLGFLPEDTPWSIIRPKDLGTEDVENNRIKFINCNVDKECIIKSYNSYVHYLYRTY